jgi:hypothetical protein
LIGPRPSMIATIRCQPTLRFLLGHLPQLVIKVFALISDSTGYD